MNKFIKINKKRKGAALIWVLILFVIITILTSSTIFITRQDIFETTQQEKRLRTYYIASSGIELAYGLLQDDDIRDDIINDIIASGTINEEIPIIIDGEQVGKTEVTLSRVTQDEIDWIKVDSIGQLEGETISVKSSMRVNEAKPDQFIKERN